MFNVRILMPTSIALLGAVVACGASGPTTSTQGSAASTPVAHEDSGTEPVFDSGAGPGPTQDNGDAASPPGSDPRVPSDGGAQSGSLCTIALGNWTATLQPGASATGSLLAVVGGMTAITGEIDFALTANSDPTLVTFNGTSTITAAGIPISITLQQGTTPCDTLHMTGKQTLPLVGLVDFAVDAKIDPTQELLSGTGTFVVTSDTDQGTSLTAKGNLDLVKK